MLLAIGADHFDRAADQPFTIIEADNISRTRWHGPPAGDLLHD